MKAYLHAGLSVDEGRVRVLCDLHAGPSVDEGRVRVL